MQNCIFKTLNLNLFYFCNVIWFSLFLPKTNEHVSHNRVLKNKTIYVYVREGGEFTFSKTTYSLSFLKNAQYVSIGNKKMANINDDFCDIFEVNLMFIPNKAFLKVCLMIRLLCMLMKFTE